MNQATLLWQERRSDSSFIESVWTSSTLAATSRAVIADPCISITLIKKDQKTEVVIEGPKTKPRLQAFPASYASTTIRLKSGVFLKSFQTSQLTDATVIFPANGQAWFRFGKKRFHFPDFDHVEQLIDALHADGCLSFRLPHSAYQSQRTYSRQTMRIIGLSPYKLYQLQRMHQALRLLKQGVAAADVATELAFTDQAHLVRASRQFFGYTPKQLSHLPQNP